MEPGDILGHPLNIKLGRDVNSAFKKARKIKRAIEERRDPISVLEEFMPDSKLLPRLKREKQADEHTVPALISAESFAQFKSTGGAVTIQTLVDAYLKGAAKASVEIERTTAKGNVFRLRDLMEVGLGYKRKKGMSDKEVAADLFSRPVSCLTPHVVDKFKDIMLGEEVSSSLSKQELMQRKNGVNSTIRQARSLFSKKAEAIYRLEGLEFPFPHGFMRVSVFSTADHEFSLPEIDRIKGIFSELRDLKKKNPDKYLVRLLGLFGGLRPQEIKWLLKSMIRNSGYWYIRIEVTDEFVPKGYHIRSIPIPEELAQEILNTCKDNGSEYIISGHKTYRIKKLFDEVNGELRQKYLKGIRRPSYELRKFFATGSKLQIGLEKTHDRMGHKDDETTKKHYIDRHATDTFLDVYKEWARALFGGEPFAG